MAILRDETELALGTKRVKTLSKQTDLANVKIVLM